MSSKLRKDFLLFLVFTFVTGTAHSVDGFSHTVLLLPDNPRIEQPWTRMIKTQEEWESFYYATTAHMSFVQSEAPVAPKLDFKNYRVLGIGLGRKYGSGHVVLVRTVEKHDDMINIYVNEITPGPRCKSIPVVNYPAAVVLVKKFDVPMRVIASTSRSECFAGVKRF